MKGKTELKIIICTTPQKMGQKRDAGASPWTVKYGIVNLFKWMEKSGYSADFYDIDMLLPSEKEIFDYFQSKNPDVVGISAVVSASYLQAKTLSNVIRRACPNALIILGGYMAASANVLLRKADIDICVLGDGENPLVEILDYVRGRENGKRVDGSQLLKIKGLAFLNEHDETEFTGYADPIPGPENPFPDYDLLAKGLLSKPHLIKNYFRVGKNWEWFQHDSRTNDPVRGPNLAGLMTSKGCPQHCTFCQRFCKGYFELDLEKFENHIIELKEKYKVGFLAIADESFGVRKEYAYRVAKILKKHEILWFFTGRCKSFKREDYKFFHECGCTGIKFGVESGSEKIFRIMEKNFGADDVYQALRDAHELGMWVPLAFCIGMPGETDQTIMETGQFLGKIARMQNILPIDMDVATFYALPFPGAPLFEYGLLRGVIGSTVDEQEEYLIFISDKTVTINNYVNLTGMSTKKVLFWQFLVHYEATRFYYKDYVKNAGYSKQLYSESFRFSKILKKLKSHNFGLGTYLNTVLSRSAVAAKIPRLLLYPVMRNLLYAEYLAKRVIFQIKKGKYSELERKNKKLSFDFRKNRCKVLIETGESLRKINKKIRVTIPGSQSLTEKNQRAIFEGR